MKSTAKVLLAIVAVAGTLAVSDAWAQSRGGGGGGGRGGSGASMGGGSRGAAWSGGGRSYSGGSHGGYYKGGYGHGGYGHGGHGHYGGYYRPYYGYGYGYWPAWSFYWGIPLWSAAWYGYPYYDNYYYPPAYSYGAPAPQATYPEYQMGPVESTEVPQGEGAPNQGPLYMNYCESSKAYFPKVSACPEGWKFITPQR
jgi:hypothetical protein